MTAAIEQRLSDQLGPGRALVTARADSDAFAQAIITAADGRRDHRQTPFLAAIAAFAGALATATWFLARPRSTELASGATTPVADPSSTAAASGGGLVRMARSDAESFTIFRPTGDMPLWQLLILLLAFAAVGALIAWVRLRQGDAILQAPRKRARLAIATFFKGTVLAMTVGVIAALPLDQLVDALQDPPTIDEAVIYTVDKTKPIERGDRVVLLAPFDLSEPDWVDWEIRTLIATAGDTVEISADTVRVNGVPVEHPELDEMVIAEPITSITIPDGQVYVVGENWTGRFDSRAYGPLDVGNVAGPIVSMER